MTSSPSIYRQVFGRQVRVLGGMNFDTFLEWHEEICKIADLQKLTDLIFDGEISSPSILAHPSMTLQLVVADNRVLTDSSGESLSSRLACLHEEVSEKYLSLDAIIEKLKVMAIKEDKKEQQRMEDAQYLLLHTLEGHILKCVERQHEPTARQIYTTILEYYFPGPGSSHFEWAFDVRHAILTSKFSENTKYSRFVSNLERLNAELTVIGEQRAVSEYELVLMILVNIPTSYIPLMAEHEEGQPGKLDTMTLSGLKARLVEIEAHAQALA